MSSQKAKTWINLGDWGVGMDEYKLPTSSELAGKELKFYFHANNQVIKYVFHDVNSLTWEILEGQDSGQSDTEKYEAICVSPNIFFVDFVRKNQPNVSVSFALGLDTGMATFLVATIPEIEAAYRGFSYKLGGNLDLSIIRVEILHANINPTSNDKPVVTHERTSDLVGKRVKYTYSNEHVYEHIYLNERFFTWHCLVGIEKGLADTEICDYFKIAPEVYLFTWREKVMPTFGVVLINFKEMRSNGKTFGLDVSSEKMINFCMGSVAELINKTNYS